MSLKSERKKKLYLEKKDIEPPRPIHARHVRREKNGKKVA